MRTISLTSVAAFAGVTLAAGWLALGCSASASQDGPAGAAASNAGGLGSAGRSSGPGPNQGGSFSLGGGSNAGSSSEPASGGKCATGTAAASRLPVYLMFVLDGSKSMNHDNKWVAAIGAINAIFGDMRTKADPGMGAGLIVYSDRSDPNLDTDNEYPTKLDVPIAFVDEGQRSKLVARTAPPDAGESNTPTGRALMGAYKELRSFKPAPPLSPAGKPVVVLITDGVPTDPMCNTDAKDGSEDYAANGCVTMAAAELSNVSAPIQTFVIGTGPLPGDFETYDPYFLGQLALAGGSAPAGCNPKSNAAAAKDLCYFNIDPTGATADATQKAFMLAIDEIRGKVASCTIAIAPDGSGAIDPARVNVSVGGMVILQDPTDGWTYDNPQAPTAVTLNGASCELLAQNPAADISVELGCITRSKPPR